MSALAEVFELILSLPRSAYGDFSRIIPLEVPEGLYARFMVERHGLPEPVLVVEGLPLPNILFKGVAVHPPIAAINGRAA